MSLEAQRQRTFLSQLSSGSPVYTFSGSINQMLYGLSGFSLSFPDHEGHNVGTMQVSTGTSRPSSSQVKLDPTLVMVDNGGNNADPVSSYVDYTVLAWVGSNNSVATLANSGLLASGSTYQPPLASTNPMTQYAPIFAGFKAAYSGGDNQVMTVQGSVTANANSGLLTLSAAMFDNKHHHDASCTVDGGLVASFVSAPGFLVKTKNNQQTLDTVKTDFSDLLQPGQTLVGCAALLTAFEVTYPNGNAHDVNTIRIGLQGSDKDGAPYVSADGKSVMLPGPMARMWDEGNPTNHTQDDKTSYVDLAVIGILAS